MGRAARASSCCTASAAPTAPGTASMARLDRATLPAAGARPPRPRRGGGRRAPDHLRGLRRARARARARALRAVRILAGRADRAACRARRARARHAAACSSPRPRGSRTQLSGPSAARCRPRARRRARTEPLEDFIERWRTQPLFAGDPPSVGALAREDQRRNRPDALAAVAARPRRRRDAAAVGPARRAEMPVARARRRARREVRRDRRGAWPSARRRASLRSSPAVTACRWRTPAVARRSRPLRRSVAARAGRRWSSQPGSTPSPARSAARSRPRRGQRVHELREQRERRQPAVRQRPAGGERRGRVQRRRRRRAGRRASRRDTPRRRWRAPAPPRRAGRRCRRSGRSSGTPRRRPRPPSAPGCGGGLVDRHPHRHPLAHLAHRRRPCVGSSTSSRPAGASASIARTACSTLPGAVRVQAQLHRAGPPRRAPPPRAPRRRRRRPSASGTRTRRATARGGLLAALRAVDGADSVALTGTDARGTSVSSAATGLPARRPARSHSAMSIAASAGGQILERGRRPAALRAARPAPRLQRRRVALQRSPRRARADAVVGLQRRRLAVADHARPRPSARR